MDSVLELPTAIRKHDSVFIIVDHLKDDPFVACIKTFDTSKIAQIYFDEVVKLHELPKTIVSDVDVKFMSYFWKTMTQDRKAQIFYCFSSPNC